MGLSFHHSNENAEIISALANQDHVKIFDIYNKKKSDYNAVNYKMLLSLIKVLLYYYKNDFSLYHMQGILYAIEHDARSIKSFKKCLKHVTNEVDVHTCKIELIYQYLYFEQYDKSVELINSIEIEKLDASNRFNIGKIQLKLDDYENGWKNIQYRKGLDNDNHLEFASILPNDLTNKTVLIKHELYSNGLYGLGIGEHVVMSRFLNVLKERGATITLANHPEQAKMNSIYERAIKIDKIINLDDISEISEKFDYSLYMMDLPYSLKINCIDDVVPPININPLGKKVKKVKKQIQHSNKRLKIGLNWRGGFANKIHVTKDNIYTQEYREIELNLLLKTLKNVDFDAVVLHDITKEEYKIFEKYSNVKVIYPCINYYDDMESIVALLSILDNYIGIKNTYMYLRSSLGKTSEILLTNMSKHSQNWLFSNKIDKNPWFPNIFVYKQSKNYNWNDALNNLENRINKQYAN